MEVLKMEELNKIDEIRKRMGVTYQEAKDALDKNNNDLVEALLYLEKNDKKWDAKLEEKGKQLTEHIRELIKKGNVTKVRLKKGERIVFEVSGTVGVLGIGGAILVPPLALIGVIGTLAALVNNYKLEIVYHDGNVEEQSLDFLNKDEDSKE